MGRWSKVIAFFAALSLASAAHARGGSFGGPWVGPGVVPNPGQLGPLRVGPGIVPNPGQLRGRRIYARDGHWRRHGQNGFGGYDYGLGFTGTPDTQIAPEEAMPAQGPVTPVLIRRPCAPPQLIEINGGLRNRIGRNVNYLRPFCGYD